MKRADVTRESFSAGGGAVCAVLVLCTMFLGQAASGEEEAAVPRLLDLDTAKSIALRNNPSLKAAEERVIQARERVKQARAAFFPALAAEANISKTQLDENTYRAQKNGATLAPLLQYSPLQTTGLPAWAAAVSNVGVLAEAVNARNAVEDDWTTYGATLAAQWTLFDGLAREFTHAAAKFGAKEVEALHLEGQRLLLAGVSGAYHTATLARESITIAEADAAYNERLLREAKARREAGAGSLSDELNFEVRLNAARATLINARRDYELAIVGLAELLAVPESALARDTELAPLREESPEDLVLPDTDALLAHALETRPDLLRQRHAALRAKNTARAQRGAFFPSLDLTAVQTATSLDDSHIGQDDFGTTVGLGLSFTLFAGGANRARLAEAKSAYRETKHALTEAEIGVTADVRDGVERLKAVQEQLVLQRESAALVRRNRDLVEKGYNAGQESLVRLNQAQTELVSAQGRLALARVELQQAWENLDAATGAILEPWTDQLGER